MRNLSNTLFFVLSLVFFACQSDDPSYKSEEFIYNAGAEPETLDPHRLSAHDASQHAIQVFEGLLSHEADYLTLRPAIAESWSVSKDGKKYLFKIRKNLKWSNGETLTLKQIRDSFIRAIDPGLAGTYSNWHTDYILGALELRENYRTAGRAEAEKKYGVRILGEDQIEVELKKPVSYFKYFFVQPVFHIIHPSMYDPDSPAWTDPKKFICNAAYCLKEWSVNERIVMEKNPHYYDVDKVAVPKIVAYPIVDLTTSLNMYETGKVDWTGDNNIPTNLVPNFQKRKDFHHMPILGTYMYEFNIKRKPLNDIRVRKALALSIDRADITNRVLRSGNVPTDRIVPPVIEGFSSKIPSEKPLVERVKEAKALLAQAGYADPSKFPKLTVSYNTRDEHHRIAQAVQQMWKKNLGIDVGLENMEWKVFLKEQQSKNFDISRKGWIGDYPDPTTFLEIFTSTSENNDSNWTNASFDRLVNEGMLIQDESGRYKKLADAEKILYEEIPAFGIYHYSYYSLMNPKVKGFKPNARGHYLFRYFSKD